MFLVSNSDNLTIPNFLQALGFMPPAGMTVDEIIIQQDSQAQAQNTLENYGFEVKEINPNYKTVSYQRKDPKLSHSFSDNYIVPEVAASELAEFPKHIQANGQIPSGQPTPQLTVIKSPVKGITILEGQQGYLLRIDEDGQVLPKNSVLRLIESEDNEEDEGTGTETEYENVGLIAKAAMFAHLFANDLKHMHWHASGTEFDKIHSITEELYEEALAEADEIAEIAIASGEKMGNISDVKSYIETGESGEWEVVSEDAITWPAFVDYLKDRGEKYIDALNDIKNEDSVIEDYIHFWNKEINYKNAARAFLDQPMEADYIDAAAEAADYLGPRDGDDNDESLSDDVVDMYVYADAKANNSSWNGFETMSSDMIVSGGEEVSKEDLENFDSESDKFNFDDVDDEEKDDE